MLPIDRVLNIGLAATNVAALTSLAWQWRGLIGESGVTPAAALVSRASAVIVARRERRAPLAAGASWGRQLLQRARWLLDDVDTLPSAFLALGGSNAAIVGLLLVGYAAIGIIAADVAPALGALLYAAVHQSFTAVGNVWTGLQFEPLLIEINTLAGVGGALAPWAPWLRVYLLRWLIVRLMFAAGAGKLSSGDKAWWDGAAMSYHYWTQPLPNWLSRFMHQLPAWWHRIETRATFIAEGPLMLLAFAGSPWIRWPVAVMTVVFNLTIAVTGNYGHLHMACIVAALAIVMEPTCPSTSSTADAAHSVPAPGPLASLLPPLPLLYQSTCPVGQHAEAASAASWAVFIAATALAVAAAGAYFAASLVPFVSNFSGLISLKVTPEPLWGWCEAAFARAQRYHVVGYYNLFASMTRFRWELQLEGTADGGVTWHPYRYLNKPGGPPASLDDAPRTLAPGYFLRSDWRMWFLPLRLPPLLRVGLDSLRSGARPAWYDAFTQGVLAGEPAVCDLVRVPPELRGRKLQAVRTLVYEYEFSTGKVAATPPVAAAAGAAPAIAAPNVTLTTPASAAANGTGSSDSGRSGSGGGGRVRSGSATASNRPAAPPQPQQSTQRPQSASEDDTPLARALRAERDGSSSDDDDEQEDEDDDDGLYDDDDDDDDGAVAEGMAQAMFAQAEGEASDADVSTAQQLLQAASAHTDEVAPPTVAEVRASVPPAVWEEGLWWRRRYACLYDVQIATRGGAAVGGGAGSVDADAVHPQPTYDAGHWRVGAWVKAAAADVAHAAAATWSWVRSHWRAGGRAAASVAA